MRTQGVGRTGQIGSALVGSLRAVQVIIKLNELLSQPNEFGHPHRPVMRLRTVSLDNGLF